MLITNYVKIVKTKIFKYLLKYKNSCKKFFDYFSNLEYHAQSAKNEIEDPICVRISGSVSYFAFNARKMSLSLF